MPISVVIVGSGPSGFYVAEALLETLERVERRVQALGPIGKTPLSLTVRQEKLLRLLRERGALGIREISRALVSS